MNYLSHYKATIKLGLPIVVGQIGVIVVGFADTLMVGQYNTASLASASFVNSVFNLIIISLLGFSYGITPLVGALFARKDYRGAGSTFKQAFVANLAFGLLLSALMAAVFPFLDYFGQPEELLPLIRPYYLTVLCSIVFVALFNAMRQFADSLMQTSIAMWILLGGNAFNIIFNYLLIYGKFGFPELGLTGAGLSTMASRILMALVFAYILLRQARYEPFRKGFFGVRTTMRGVLRNAKVSLPVALQMAMETGTFTFSAVMVGWIGAAELASFQVMVTIGTLGFMFYYSVGAAIAIRVASYAGKEDIVGLRRSAWAGYHILLLFATAASTIFFVFSDALIRVFTDDPAVSVIAVTLIVPLVLYQYGDATQICFANVLRGTARVMPIMWIAFFSFVVVGIPAAYLLGFPAGLGVQGVFLSFSVSLFVAAVLFFWDFQRATRRR